ncbi:MAG TPA: response regulator [Spirochaetota bacterium]|nr:response regulator [Spirochaetota bacterium]
MEYKDKSILVVDDERSIRETVADYLEDSGCRPEMAADGIEALDKILNGNYDAVIMDLNMPGMTGLEVLDKVVLQFPEMPVIVFSGVGILDRAMEAIRKGAWDFISKPITSFSILSLTLNRALERARLLRENRLYRENLEEEVRKKTEQVLEMSRSLITTQKEIILRLGDVVETRSHETAHHVRRVSEYAYLLSKLSGISEKDADDIKLASAMHDVGKIGTPDGILNKPGRLTGEEFEIIKQHTVTGHSIFKTSELPVLKLAAEIALNHHEQWLGAGYPNGIAGENIPHTARITAIVDVFDAITHARIYKTAWDVSDAYMFMKEQNGIMFDPGLTGLFITNFEMFREIHDLLPD